jgi:hypothetical protein
MPDLDLNSNQIDSLATLVEEGARAANRTVPRFVEPARGTLRRATSRRHHIVFGRRGSGKTSLLLKAAYDLSSKKSPVAYVDLERFKGHEYPDVLISVLIESLEALTFALKKSSSNSEDRNRFQLLWERLITSKKTIDVGNAVDNIESAVEELRSLLSQSSETEVTDTQRTTEQESRASGGSIAGQLPASLAVEASLSGSKETSSSRSVEEKMRRSKIQFLINKTLDYSKVVGSMSEALQKDAYLFLDDLYHLRKEDQPQVLDYFHRLFKGRKIWLKVGTVRH